MASLAILPVTVRPAGEEEEEEEPATSVPKLATSPGSAPLPTQTLYATTAWKLATIPVTAPTHLLVQVTRSATTAIRLVTLPGTAQKGKTSLLSLKHLFPANDVAGPAKCDAFEWLMCNDDSQ